jgi:hypothetical protein
MNLLRLIFALTIGQLYNNILALVPATIDRALNGLRGLIRVLDRLEARAEKRIASQAAQRQRLYDLVDRSHEVTSVIRADAQRAARVRSRINALLS